MTMRLLLLLLLLLIALVLTAVDAASPRLPFFYQRRPPSQPTPKEEADYQVHQSDYQVYRSSHSGGFHDGPLPMAPVVLKKTAKPYWLQNVIKEEKKKMKMMKKNTNNNKTNKMAQDSTKTTNDKKEEPEQPPKLDDTIVETNDGHENKARWFPSGNHRWF
jgi:hypothetical protein